MIVRACTPPSRKAALIESLVARSSRLKARRRRGPMRPQVARRRTSQTVTAISRADSKSSQPPSIHWNGQNLLAG